jgi:hypothetical protein
VIMDTSRGSDTSRGGTDAAGAGSHMLREFTAHEDSSDIDDSIEGGESGDSEVADALVADSGTGSVTTGAVSHHRARVSVARSGSLSASQASTQPRHSTVTGASGAASGIGPSPSFNNSTDHGSGSVGMARGPSEAELAIMPCVVLAWGRCDDGQLGIGKVQLHCDTPQKISRFPVR